MANRRKMQAGDWFNGTALLAVGVFLGLALDGMSDLVGTAFWPLIIIIPVLFGAVFVFAQVFEGMIARIFPSGIKPAAGHQKNEQRPLALVLSLPCGLVLGVIGGQMGLRALLL